MSENNTFAHVTVVRRETDKEEKQTEGKIETDRDKHRGKVI